MDYTYEDYKTDPQFDDLRKAGINFVPGYGPYNPDIMLVGEAPGGLENARGRPFVGKAGKYLDQLLESIDIDPEDVYITNVVKYWPTDHRGNTRTPTEEEIAASRPYLFAEFARVKSFIVGLCGLSAVRAVYPNYNDIHTINGTLIDECFVPLYHPALMGYKPLMSGKIRKGYKMLNEHLLTKKK